MSKMLNLFTDGGFSLIIRASVVVALLAGCNASETADQESSGQAVAGETGEVNGDADGTDRALQAETGDQTGAESAAADPFLVVLGVAQDAGIPQVGAWDHPGWRDRDHRRRVSSLGLVDPATGRRWLFDATPDIRDQLFDLAQTFDHALPTNGGLSGVFLTHAHIGHYTGLLFLGHESMGAAKVPVYVMPRFAQFLKNNGPWDQLIRFENIRLQPLVHQKRIELGPNLSVIPFLVPHRQEYSEVVGYRIEGPTRKVVYLPDIDSWEAWDEAGVALEDVVVDADVAYLDATFYADGEIPGRDMSGFPHPFITHTMERLANKPDLAKKVRFIHLNHTNPAQFEDSEARASLEAAGFRVAVEGETVTLGDAGE